MNATLSGVAAASWLGGLWYAAPLLYSTDIETERPARRIRSAILLGTAIPAVLAGLSVLTAATCALALVFAVIARRLYRPRQAQATSSLDLAAVVGRAIPTTSVLLTAWPALVRPIMQGDSLGYHLPNAASWSATHSLFTTGTWYWWYPGGSELFAAGVFTVAGPLSVGLSGLVASMLLAHRLYAFAARAQVPPIPSGLFSAAFMTIPIVALQSASLENDVWLSAWLLEILWAVRQDRQAITQAIAVCALIKPYGFVFATFAVIFGRARSRAILLGFVPLALWLGRDVVLWHTATIDPAVLIYPHVEATTIAAHGFQGISVLAASLWTQGPGTILATIALFMTLIWSRDELIRFTALGAAAFFLIEPFGFGNDLPQLATGASLRYALPAIAVGCAGALPLLRCYAAPLAFAFFALAAFQIYRVVDIFNNDAMTHGVFFVALALSFACIIPDRVTRHVMTVLLSFSIVVYAVRLAGTHPNDYYGEAIAHQHSRSHLFAWLATEQPRAAVGYQLRTGAIAAVSPYTIVYDATGLASCAEARRLRAVLVIADDPTTNTAAFSQRRTFGHACGDTLYEDTFALVVRPHTARQEPVAPALRE